MELIGALQGLTHRKGPKILVVGDIMLDHYRIGDASRISPEAPVPVLVDTRDECRLGGAAAVAAMCAALGAEVALCGVVGSDASGQIVLRELQAANVIFAGNVETLRPTTTKERICALASGRHRQQLARIDREWTSDIGEKSTSTISDMVGSLRGDPADAIIVADYAKGVCTEFIIEHCIASGMPVFVDPPRSGSWVKYRQSYCLVPNREEAQSWSAREVAERYYSTTAVVKLDEEGCEYFAPQHPAPVRVPAKQRALHDVTGAGDQFIATLAWAKASGLDFVSAVHLANVAAGLQVERHGCVPVAPQEILRELKECENHAQLLAL